MSFGQVQDGNRFGILRLRDVHDFDSVMVTDECVTELEFDIAGFVEPFAFRQNPHDVEILVILDIHDDHSGVAGNPGILAPDGNATCSVQNTIRIEHNILLDEVVIRIAIKQRPGTDKKQPFTTVCAIDECIPHRYRLFEVFRLMRPCWIRSHRGRRSHVSAVLRSDVKLLSEW